MRGTTLPGNLRIVPLWDILKGKAVIQRSSAVQRNELMGVLSVAVEQLCCKSPGVLVGGKGECVIWGPGSWLWSGLFPLSCRQAVSLGKWLFTSHQYLRYHIWTEHVILDSQMPERCGYVEVQQNTPKVRDSRRCDRWDKTEKQVCPGQRKSDIEEIVLWSASASWEGSKKTDLGCSQEMISGRTRGNRQNAEYGSEL